MKPSKNFLSALTSSFLFLALVGCASEPVEEATLEVISSPTESEESTEDEREQPEIEATDTSEFTESGFPQALAPEVRNYFDGLVRSVLKVGDEFNHGTGWILSSDIVLTNWHVVDFMEAPIQMLAYDGELLLGEVIATDEFDDIAVIRLFEPTQRPGLALSGSRPLPGEPVFYIGNPSSIGDWITGVGVVGDYQEFFESFVRTTLPTSPGASGSPMFNMEGEVVALISGCMVFDASEEPQRVIGDGQTLYSVDPQPPVTENCGGTEIEKVMDFVSRYVDS